MAFVHPFDDPDVIAGQGSSGSSCSSRCPTSRRSSSRSAAAGWPRASRSRSSRARPEVEVVGVQAAAVAAFPRVAAAGQPVDVAAGDDDRRRHRGQAARASSRCRWSRAGSTAS